MRRTLEVLSLGLFLVGLEVAVGIPSLTLVRLRQALAFRSGVEGMEGIRWRSVVGILLLLIALVVAAVSVLVRRGQKRIQDHIACPVCGTRTSRVRRTRWERLLGRLMGKSVAARLCGDCSWRGLSYLH